MTKKFSLIMLVIVCVFALLLTACDKDVPNNGDESTGVPESESESLTESAADPYDFDLKLVANGVAEYKIVRSASASKNAMDAATLVYDAISAATGVMIDYSDDYVLRGQEPKADDKEILIGLTNRDESKTARADVPYGEYAIKKVGAKLVVFAWDDASLAKACEELAAHIQGVGAKDQLTVSKDYFAKGTGFQEINDLPVYDTKESNTQVVDLADDSYMIYLDNTDKTEFEAYLGKLENLGYKQFAKREASECSFATYTNDEYIINVTFTEFENNARVTFDAKYDMSILEGGAYTKVCDPTVSLVGLEIYADGSGNYAYNQSGLFMIFRLEDGRFILVDSGGYNSSMSQTIYDNLCSMAPDRNDITIAAWIFTHAHSDHTGGFLKLANSSYASRVKVESFVLNLTTTEQYAGIPNGADYGRSVDVRETIASKYPESTIIKIHTGQVIKIADAEIEMLYTFDDILPQSLTFHNTTSLVFRYQSNGYTVTCLGDAYTVTSARLVEMYGEYLKSDMVQIAHHGFAGGTNALYKDIAATVNLWPGGAEAFDGKRNLRGEPYNKYALGLESVKETYIAGQSVFTFTLPYTPDPSHQNTVIKG